MATTTVNWISADLDAQASALAGLHTATGLPWTAYLADKASSVAAWWSTSGSVEYLDWVSDVNSEYSAHNTTVCAEYTTMVTAVTTAQVEYTTNDALETNDSSTDQADSAADSAQDQADATAAYQTAISTATLNLADDGDQAAYDSAVAAADLAYQQSAAAAKGDAAVGTAQATDDYVDAVYGDDGGYETWQDTVSSAETAYKLATSAASETLNKNISAHDAALTAALADTYADALEDLADDYTPANPWATRDAADARAESDKVATEQTAKETFEQAVATAEADFEETAANAEQTRTATQTTALQTKMQTESSAALTQATNQKAADDAAAAAGAGTEKKPDEKETPEDPEDATAAFEDVSSENDPIASLLDSLGASPESQVFDTWATETNCITGKTSRVRIRVGSSVVPAVTGKKIEYFRDCAARRALGKIHANRQNIVMGIALELFRMLKDTPSITTPQGETITLTEQDRMIIALAYAQGYVASVENFLREFPGAKPWNGTRLYGDAESDPVCEDWMAGMNTRLGNLGIKSVTLPSGRQVKLDWVINMRRGQHFGITGWKRDPICQHNFNVVFPAGYTVTDPNTSRVPKQA